MSDSLSAPQPAGLTGLSGRALLRLVMPTLFAAVLLFFALKAPGFLTVGNLSSLLLNNFVLLAIVAIGMTYAIAAGGIDLSVGTALDFSALTFVLLLNAGFGLYVAIPGGLLAGSLAGLFNAGLIAGLRISPFLATLGTLFIGSSVQKLLSDGGQPIYLEAQVRSGLASERLLGVPLPLLLVALLALVYGVVLARGRLGREIIVLGSQPLVARYSGLAQRRISALVFIASAFASALAGILLPATVTPTRRCPAMPS